MRLSGQVALITGSTRGIGEEIAYEFAREGASVVLTGRGPERGEHVAKTIQANGGNAVFVQTDVSIESNVQQAMEETKRSFGGLNVLVNNAAATDQATAMAPLVEYATEDFDRQLKVNLYGPFWCCKYGIPLMLEAGGGSIINISSMSADRGFPAIPGYTCSKAGLSALTRQVAADYGRSGIRANTIVVGVIVNELTAGLVSTPEAEAALRGIQLIDKLGECADIAKLAVYLASDESALMTGQALTMDGGITIRGPLTNDQVQTCSY